MPYVLITQHPSQLQGLGRLAAHSIIALWRNVEGGLKTWPCKFITQISLFRSALACLVCVMVAEAWQVSLSSDRRCIGLSVLWLTQGEFCQPWTTTERRDFCFGDHSCWWWLSSVKLLILGQALLSVLPCFFLRGRLYEYILNLLSKIHQDRSLHNLTFYREISNRFSNF